MDLADRHPRSVKQVFLSPWRGEPLPSFYYDLEKFAMAFAIIHHRKVGSGLGFTFDRVGHRPYNVCSSDAFLLIDQAQSRCFCCLGAYHPGVLHCAPAEV